MLNTYRFTMPSVERARELGFKLEGQCQRTTLFLMGVAYTVKAMDSNIQFTVGKVCDYEHQRLVGNCGGFVEFSTDSVPLFEQLWELWKKYGLTCVQIGGMRNGESVGWVEIK